MLCVGGCFFGAAAGEGYMWGRGGGGGCKQNILPACYILMPILKK